jgi:hypothetical protein
MRSRTLHPGFWLGLIILIVTSNAQAAEQVRPQPDSYPFLAEKPRRHALGMTFGLPGYLAVRYEFSLSREGYGNRPARIVSLNAFVMPTGGGVHYKQRLAGSPLYFTSGYDYVSLPQSLLDGDVDLGPPVRHNLSLGFEFRTAMSEGGRLFLFGGGGVLEMLPDRSSSVKLLATFGVVHRL